MLLTQEETHKGICNTFYIPGDLYALNVIQEHYADKWKDRQRKQE